MSAFDLSWHQLKKAWYDNEDFRGDPEDEGAYRRGEEEDHQNWLNDSKNEDDSRNERVDAPTLDSNHILRLTREQINQLIQDSQSELQRRDTKKANRNVAVVDSPVKGMENANEWAKHNPWMGE